MNIVYLMIVLAAISPSEQCIGDFFKWIFPQQQQQQQQQEQQDDPPNVAVPTTTVKRQVTTTPLPSTSENAQLNSAFLPTTSIPINSNVATTPPAGHLPNAITSGAVTTADQPNTAITSTDRPSVSSVQSALDSNPTTSDSLLPSTETTQIGNIPNLGITIPGVKLPIPSLNPFDPSRATTKSPVQLIIPPLNFTALGLNIPGLDNAIKPFNDILVKFETQILEILDVIKTLDIRLYENLQATLVDLQQILSAKNITSIENIMTMLDAAYKVLDSIASIMDAASKLDIPTNQIPLFDNTRQLVQAFQSAILVIKSTLQLAEAPAKFMSGIGNVFG